MIKFLKQLNLQFIMKNLLLKVIINFYFIFQLQRILKYY